MHSEKLVQMANHIAQQFKAYGNDKGIAMFAEHLNMFWSAAMRTELAVLANDDTVSMDDWCRRVTPQLQLSRDE